MSDSPAVTNEPTIFLARKSELRDRFDPEIIRFRRKVQLFQYPAHALRELFSAHPQYGAGEPGIERTSDTQPRYIRITDIDENGLLRDELGVTAANLEPRFLLCDNDLLVARSGNTVGKAYLHKTEWQTYDCFYAGYLIRLRFDTTLVLPDYVFVVTQTSYYKSWIQAVQRRAGQPNVNAEEYSGFLIPLPPLPTQASIVASAYGTRSKAQELQRQALLEFERARLSTDAMIVQADAEE